MMATDRESQCMGTSAYLVMAAAVGLAVLALVIWFATSKDQKTRAATTQAGLSARRVVAVLAWTAVGRFLGICMSFQNETFPYFKQGNFCGGRPLFNMHVLGSVADDVVGKE